MKATIRVRGATGDTGTRPEPERLQRAAYVLSEEGFEILHVGRFGISVCSEMEVFCRVLGVEPSGVSVVKLDPVSEELKELLDVMQVDSEPEFFDE